MKSEFESTVTHSPASPPDELIHPVPTLSLIREPAWFADLLRCPHCGQGSMERMDLGYRCTACTKCSSAQAGLVHLLDPNMEKLVRAGREAWRVREELTGKRELTLSDALQMPRDAEATLGLEWLRSRLSGRGPLRILELGAGTGWASRALAADGHEVVACDIQTDSRTGLGRAVGQREATGRWFGCVVAQAESLPFQDGAFDCVFAFSLLRHIPDLERVFSEAARVLRPKGTFFAFRDSYRGSRTTAIERLQDCLTNRLIHAWLVGEMDKETDPEILFVRRETGRTIHEISRRAGFCIQLARQAGLEASVRPMACLQDWEPDGQMSGHAGGVNEPVWLEYLSQVHDLDKQTFAGRVADRQRENPRFVSELAQHWLDVGNHDGAILCRKSLSEKGSNPWPSPVHPQQLEPKTRDNAGGPTPFRTDSKTQVVSRQSCSVRQPGQSNVELDRFLLGCSPKPMLPVYGVHPRESTGGRSFHWLMPQAGILVPAGQAIAVTLKGPSSKHCSFHIHVQIRFEDDRAPALVGIVMPDNPRTFRIPVPRRYQCQGTVLLRLWANVGFMPSDFDKGAANDARLMSLLLTEVAVETDESKSLLGTAA